MLTSFLVNGNFIGPEPTSKLQDKVSITIRDGSVGFIVDADTNQAIGTGFVAMSARQVVTCDHVAKARKNLIYAGVGQTVDRSHRLTLKTSMPDVDIAVFSTDEDVCDTPLVLGDIRGMSAGDRIIYLGFKVEAKSIEANTSTVIAVVTSRDSGVEYMDFVGVGKPGFSGGPVFNGKGNVVALMREAFTKPTSTGAILINRAFSTRPLMKQN